MFTSPTHFSYYSNYSLLNTININPSQISTNSIPRPNITYSFNTSARSFTFSYNNFNPSSITNKKSNLYYYFNTPSLYIPYFFQSIPRQYLLQTLNYHIKAFSRNADNYTPPKTLLKQFSYYINQYITNATAPTITKQTLPSLKPGRSTP